MWKEITPGNTFDFASHHVAMINTTAHMFHAALPHSTVSLTMGAADLTAPSEAIVLKAYPIPELAKVADQIFVMAYKQPRITTPPHHFKIVPTHLS